jgi:hypothetical protein
MTVDRAMTRVAMGIALSIGNAVLLSMFNCAGSCRATAVVMSVYAFEQSNRINYSFYVFSF